MFSGLLGRYPLRVQFLAGFLCLGFITTAIASVSFFMLYHIESHAMEHDLPAHQMETAARAINLNTLQCRLNEKDMFLNMADSEAFQLSHNKWIASLDALRKGVDQLGLIPTADIAEDPRAITLKWHSLIAQYQDAVNTVFSDIESGQITNPSDANLALTPYTTEIGSLTTQSRKMSLAKSAQAIIERDLMQTAIARSRLAIGLLGGVSLLLGGGLALFLSTVLTRRVRYLCTEVEVLTSGNYSTRISLAGNDELAVLGNDIDGMAERINERTRMLEDDLAHREITERELKEHKEQLQAINNSLEQQTSIANSLAAEAEMANAAKSEFLANMSHEIRTPMTAILGFVDILREEGNLNNAPKHRLDAIDTIRRNGEHLLQLINDILDISKIEADKLEVESISFSPVQIVADVQSLMQVRADAKDLSFDIEFIDALPETITSDPTRLKQILVNLTGNAIKFTETGKVRLVTSLVSDGTKPKIQFDVIDTGIGMTDDQISKLFQAFTQADSSTTRKFGGTGLGLLISKRLAEMLGGNITVESEPGNGTTFRVTLDAGSLQSMKLLDNPNTTEINRSPTTASEKDKPIKLDCNILLAEDGPDNQRLISFVLKKVGAEVTVVENGKLAVDAALAARDAGTPFDVILMDMQMPIMGGYEASTLLRRKGYTGSIIALTAHAMADDRKKCIDAGCNDYTTKPINRKKMFEMIQYWQQNPSAPNSNISSRTAA